jgi:PIN domain
MNKKPTYCWDATVFVAWLIQESSAPLAEISAIVEEIDRANANLLVPVTAYSEVLDAKHSQEQMDQFRLFLKRSNVIVADTTQAIAKKSGQIRSRALAANPSRKIKTPDATFMATAIIFQADVFHTLEKNQLPGLSGTAIVDGLKIDSPKSLIAPSAPLFEQVPSASSEPPPPS